MSMKIIGELNVSKYKETLENHLNNMFKVFEKCFPDKQKKFLKEIESNNWTNLNQARSSYSRNMTDVVTQNSNISMDELQQAHITIRRRAIDIFVASRVDGDPSFEKYCCNLSESIDEVYAVLQNQLNNNSITRWTNIKDTLQMILNGSVRILEIILHFRLLRQGLR